MGYSVANMNKAFADIANAGSTVVRTWYVTHISIRISTLTLTSFLRGFNDVTSANGVFYQSWSGSSATVNMGSSGLQNFGK